MSTATTYAKLGYLMLSKETTAGTAVFPGTGIELLSESIVTNWDFTPSETIAGNRSANLRPIKNRVGPATGSIEILVEPNTLGHFLTGVFGEATDSTLEALLSFQHDFEPLTTLETYTMDVKIAGENYVERYFGVMIESVEFTMEDNKVKLTINVQAQRSFQNARITTAAGSGTALLVDQTSGLVAGSDTIIILDRLDPSTELAELTVTTVTDENTLVVSTIGVALEVDDIVVIKKQTPSYDLSNELIFSGGAQVALANGANGIQNLSAYTNVEDITVTITNDLEPRWTAVGNDVIDRFPACILIKGVTVEGSFTQFHTNPEMLDILRELEQTTLRFEWLGGTLASNVAAAASADVETDGADTITIAVDTAGEAGNDWAYDVVLGTGALSAALSGKLITVTLDATPANNDTTSVAAVINALAGVSTSDTGTDLVTVADNPSKFFFSAGRDANEIEKLRIDLPNVRLLPFNANLTGDDIVNEEINFTAFRDEDDERDIQIRLRNSISDY